MHAPHQIPDMNARGRMMAARRQADAARIWQATRTGPRLGFFCALREAFGARR